MKKRILSIFMAVLLMLNCFPVSVLAIDEDDGQTLIVSEDKIKVIDKAYDGNKIAEVDCSEALDINENGVHLIVDASFESENASNEPIKVTISNFRLEGINKDNYRLSMDYDQIEKYAYITPKELTVTPNETSIYFGQNIPNLTYTIEPIYVEGIDLTIENYYSYDKLPVGRYNYTVKSHSPNYTVNVDEGVVFEVKEYIPNRVAIPENEDNSYHSNQTELAAPDGFLISNDRVDFQEKITITLEETLSDEHKEVSYYLKNDNKFSSEFGAISNEMKYSYSNKTDEKSPEITYINIRKSGAKTKTTDPDIENVEVEPPFNMYSFGNYTNTEIELVIKVKDISNSDFISGISSVRLLDGDKELFNLVGNKDENYEYVFKIEPNTKIGDMRIGIRDGIGNEYSNSVVEEIKSRFENENEDPPDSCLKNMKSNLLVVENKESQVDFVVSNSLNAEKSVSDKNFIYNSDNKVWYNKDDGKFTICTYDNIPNSGDVCSGIHSVKITWLHNDKEKIDEIIFDDGQVNFYQHEIAISKLENGEHKYIIEVIDNAGNTTISEQYIYIDRELPVGEILIESPKSKVIDENQWFDKDDKIIFRVNASVANSGVEMIALKVNKQDYIFSGEQIKGNKEDGYFISISTNELSNYDEQKYVVSGTVINFAQNKSKLEPLTVYVDCENPEIKKFTVEKKSTALDKILNVLTFGVYSNDTLILKVEVSDAPFDSGVDYVTIIHNELDTPVQMKNEGDSIYSIEISSKTKIFQSDIVVTVYDKYGKANISSPNIQNAEENGGVSDNVFVMIETVQPEITVIKPKCDGVERMDNEIWYNSNKFIEIIIQDVDSGIRNVDIKVNGVDVTVDKNDVEILKPLVTAASGERDNQEYTYIFDTDYFTSIVGEPDDGKYEITVEVIDNAGNVAVSENNTYYIDILPPSIDKFELVSKTIDNTSETSEYIEILEYGFYFKEAFIANIYISDNAQSSGLDKIEYRLVSYESGEIEYETTGEKPILDGVASIDIPNGFKGQIFVKAFDKTGNKSDEKTPHASVIDDTQPEINISEIGDSRYYDANGNKLYTSDVEFTVTITDYKSGLREIGYLKGSENDGFLRKVITIENANYELGMDLGDGWVISKMDANLVTEVTKAFIFTSDDNDIALFFDATDNSGNINESVQSDTFTIDKIDPVINIEVTSGINGTNYYNANNKAIITITVIERNFDSEYINTMIKNDYNGNIPTVVFENISATEHRAVITFAEGDYFFDVSGMDLGGHQAIVNFPDDRSKMFFVDENKPIIEENFVEFTSDKTENFFNDKNKTAVIKITEHNFDPSLVGLRIMKKDAGLTHDSANFTDVTDLMVGGYSWVSVDDTHTLTIEFWSDAIYQVEIYPSDLAGNISEFRNTDVFEIDTTIPIAISKNGESVLGRENENEFLDVYPFSRKDEDAPTVEFSDVNLVYIKYDLTVYVPEYTNGKELSAVKPVKIYLDEDKNKTGRIDGNLFILPDFNKDGVYALELIAVDKAGNESVLNLNTYMRLVENDVLAYIPNSSLSEKTGWYSFQYENGDAISKKPDDFIDIDIVVLTKTNSNINIVLRDFNGDEKDTNLQIISEEQMYGVGMYEYTLESGYFKQHFQNDTDVELYLSVKNDADRIDLGKIHIDNIMPSCELPNEFESWHWYFGEDTQTITITNISESLDEIECKVYDDGKEIDFVYSSKDDTLTFSLDKGWHNIGVKLVDTAGNSNDIQEISNLYVGYFWLWIIVISSCIVIVATVLIVYKVRKKRKLSY